MLFQAFSLKNASGQQPNHFNSAGITLIPGGPWVSWRPVFETCTDCGGPVVSGGGDEYHCTRQLPLFGEELLAGRDPCADYALPHVTAEPGAQPSGGA
jgi:hypothetical protein